MRSSPCRCQKRVQIAATAVRPPSHNFGNIQSLLDLADAPELPLDAADDLIAQRVPCRRGCGAHYCSEACENAAFDEGHRLLCGASAFTKFARRTNAYLFGARVAARVACGCAEIAEFCCSAPWWELEAGNDREEAARLREEAAHALRLLRGALFGDQRKRRRDDDGWLSLTTWGRLLGQIRQNAICVELQNPVAEVLPALREWHDAGFGGAAIADVLRALRRRGVPPARGTALLPLVACANHDCEPNAEVHFLERAMAIVVATRAIAEGEAVTISYIDGNARDGVEARRRALAEYGFVCECGKCAREAAARGRLRRRE